MLAEEWLKQTKPSSNQVYGTKFMHENLAAKITSMLLSQDGSIHGGCKQFQQEQPFKRLCKNLL
jgi:hypothetical protein